MPNVPLEDALTLTYLYAEKEQWEKFERTAMNFLRRGTKLLREVDEKAATAT